MPAPVANCWFLGGANGERLTSSRVSEMQHSSWEVSMCIKAFRITVQIASSLWIWRATFLWKVLQLRPSSPKNISTKNTQISTFGRSLAATSKEVKKKKKQAVPLEDLRCRHHLPVILLIRFGNVFSVLLDLSRSGLLWFPSWCFCWDVFVGIKSQRNNIFQTILSMYFPKTYPRFAMALKDKPLRIVSIAGTSVEDSLCLFRTSACQSQVSLTSG